VTLAANTTTPQAGQSVTLTATANQDVGPTPYSLQIYHVSTGSTMVTCGSGTTCAATASGLAAGQSASFRARISYSDGTSVQAQSNTVTVTASGGSAIRMTSPTPGSRFTSTTVTFGWTSGALEYWLYVGTTGAGSANVHNSGSIGTTTSRTVSGLPSNNSTVYVRLWYRNASGWQYTDYTYGSCNPLLAC
jgi:serine protease